MPGENATPEVNANAAGNPPEGSAAGGGNLTDWRASLPEDIRSEKSLESIKGKDWNDAGPVLAKSFVNAQKLVGSRISVPKDDDKPEVWNDFYTKLGRPESPDQYEIARPQELVDAGLWDAGMEGSFRETAHKLGLTPRQVAGLVDWQTKYVIDTQGALVRNETEVMAELRKQWGPNTDRHVGLAKRTVREVGGIELADFLNKTGLGNHPGMIRFMAKVGGMLAEDNHIAGDVPGVAGPEQAKQKIAEIQANPKHPYFVEGPGHKEAVEEMARLYALAYPQV